MGLVEEGVYANYLQSIMVQRLWREEWNVHREQDLHIDRNAMVTATKSQKE